MCAWKFLYCSTSVSLTKFSSNLSFHYFLKLRLKRQNEISVSEGQTSCSGFWCWSFEVAYAAYQRIKQTTIISRNLYKCSISTEAAELGFWEKGRQSHAKIFCIAAPWKLLLLMQYWKYLVLQHLKMCAIAAPLKIFGMQHHENSLFYSTRNIFGIAAPSVPKIFGRSTTEFKNGNSSYHKEVPCYLMCSCCPQNLWWYIVW